MILSLYPEVKTGKTTVILAVVASVSLLASGIGLVAQNRGGDEDRIRYELAATHLLRGQSEEAGRLFREVAAGNTAYADLARLELIRMLAYQQEAPEQEEIRQLVQSVEAADLMPRAYLTAGHTLEARGDSGAALVYYLELCERLPEDPLTADARYGAARLLYAEGSYEASLMVLFQLLDENDESDLKDDALVLMARVYRAPGPHENGLRACQALSEFLRRSGENGFRDSPWRNAVLSEQRLWCG